MARIVQIAISPQTDTDSYVVWGLSSTGALYLLQTDDEWELVNNTALDE